MSITPDRWRRIETVYLSAAKQPAERRAAWLAATCGEDTDLRHEVESLLTQHTSTAAMLERGAEAAASALIRNAGVWLAPGRRIGHYEILAPVGAGGMGEVYRARDSKLGRDVAIKVLPRAFTEDPDRLARFEREARVLASLNHPNIATIHGVEDNDGVTALVLELVEGTTLADRTSRGRALRGRGRACRSRARSPTALEAAHERASSTAISKPANIEVTPDGPVKVLDFGLAKSFAADGAHSARSPRR